MHGPRAACVLVGLALLFVAGCDRGQQSLNNADKVIICHATSSGSNPYTRNRVAKDGAVSGHDGHTGDIIPVFTYRDNAGVQHTYPGKNLESGQAILDNGCKVPGPTTSVASGGAETTVNGPSGSPPTTDDSDIIDETDTTDTGSGSSGPATTISRDSTPTTLAIAGPTTPTTTAVSGPTTTSATSSGGVPPAVDAGPSSTSSTPTTTGTGQAEAEAPAGLGSTTTSSGGDSAATPSSTGDSALANTGSTSTPLLVGALLLVLVGTLGVVVARRREAT